MKKQSLYRDLAAYYDLIYYQKDYKKEADTILKLIAKHKKSNGKDLLEVACGTGSHLKYLKHRFCCTGTDISKDILKLAEKKVKNVSFKKADMITFNLHKKFDIITCLFSSIGYVKTYSNLRKTINNFAQHLKPEGVVIIEPWFDKSSFIPGYPHMTTYESKDLKIARTAVSKQIKNLSVVDMHYLIAEKNKEVRHVVDRHEFGLFDRDKTLQFMKQAGLKAKFLKNGLTKGRGLFIGVKE